MRLNAVVANLGPREQLLVEFLYYRDLSQEIVSDALQLSASQIGKLHRKILHKLQMALRRPVLL